MDILHFLRAVANQSECVKGKMVELSFPESSLNQGARYVNGQIVQHPVTLRRPAVLVGTVIDVILYHGSPLDPVAVISQNNTEAYVVGMLELVKYLQRICETGLTITLHWELSADGKIQASTHVDSRPVLPSAVGSLPPYGSGLARKTEAFSGDKESSCLVLSSDDSHWVAYPSPSQCYQEEPEN